MKTVLIISLITLTSCGSNSIYYRNKAMYVKSCPEGYMHNIYDGMCYHLTPYYAIRSEVKVIENPMDKPTVKPKKKPNKEAINCVKALNFCGVSR